MIQNRWISLIAGVSAAAVVLLSIFADPIFRLVSKALLSIF